MDLFEKLRARLKREHFLPTWLGLLVNPVYIVRRGLLNALLGVAPNVKGRVLDVGCGAKPYRDLFVNSSSYIGCDIEVSGHNHSDSKIDCFFDGKTLPFGDKKFDAVVSFEVFEHVFDLPRLLEEVNRVTKPEGYLLISVPFVWAEHEDPFDFARYSSFGISHLLKECGYQVVELNKIGNHLLVIFQLMISYFYQVLSPKNKWGRVFQLLFIFPLMLLAHLLSAIFPKRYDLFYGSMVLARKVDLHADNSRVSAG